MLWVISNALVNTDFWSKTWQEGEWQEEEVSQAGNHTIFCVPLKSHSEYLVKNPVQAQLRSFSKNISKNIVKSFGLAGP